MIFKNIKKFTSRFIPSLKQDIQSYKKLFFNRIFLLFTFFLIIGNIYLFRQYILDIYAFALNEEVYSINNNFHSVDIESILFEKFFSTLTRNYAGGITIGLILYTEIFTVITFILLIRKHYRKRVILPYLLIIQILSASLILLAFGFAPSIAIDSLNNEATEDIKKQLSLISSTEGLEQLSVESTPEGIKNKLLLSSDPPMIMDEYADVFAIIYSLDIKEEDTLYRAVILPKVISEKEEWGLSYNALLLPNNILVMKNPTRKLLNEVLPTLSMKIIEKEMSKYIKNKRQPNFAVLSDDAYDIVQNQKIDKVKDDYINRIAQIKKEITEADNYIQSLSLTIASLEQEKSSYKNRADKALIDCREYFGAEGCRKEENIVARNMESIDNNLKSALEALQGWKNLRPKIASSLNITQKSYEDFLKFPITPEIQDGVFQPPDSIYVKYRTEGDNIPSPSDYLNVGIHEYLHYLSDNDGELLPTFINEGFTDYLANDLTKKYSYRAEIRLRYPEEVSIIKRLVKSIPENALLITYFDNSERLFETLINATYPKGTYEELLIKGESLTYLNIEDVNSREQILQEILTLLPEKSATSSGQKTR